MSKFSKASVSKRIQDLDSMIDVLKPSELRENLIEEQMSLRLMLKVFPETPMMRQETYA